MPGVSAPVAAGGSAKLPPTPRAGAAAPVGAACYRPPEPPRRSLPMIELRDLCYIRLGTRDLATAERFATEIVGLQAIRRSADRLYLRSNYRDHSLCYFRGEAKDQAVGIELKNWDGLESAMEQLAAAGRPAVRGTREESADRAVEDFCWFADPTGNRIELVVRPHDANRRYFPARDAGIKGFGHIGLNTTDAKRDERFWTSLFNFRV